MAGKAMTGVRAVGRKHAKIHEELASKRKPMGAVAVDAELLTKTQGLLVGCWEFTTLGNCITVDSLAHRHGLDLAV